MTRSPHIASLTCRTLRVTAGASALATSLVLGSVSTALTQETETGPGQTPGLGPSTAPSLLRPYAPGTPQLGIGGTPERPATAVLRQDEDWSWLAGVPEDERRALDGLKYVPLTPDGSTFLTFAFDGLAGFEWFNDASFGDNPGEDLTWHFRANPHVALTIADRVRLYGALKFGEVNDSRFVPSPADDDGPDVHQAFAEVAFGDLFGLPTKQAFVRVGRQELHYGAGRLVSIRNGPNARFDFNGAVARARVGPVLGEALYVRPSENDRGAFDNGVDETQALWGLYTTTALGDVLPDVGPLLNRFNLDLYYIGFERETSPYAFQMAPLDETRHTIGARFWTGGPPTDGWNFDLEAGYQFGTADGILSPTGPIGADVSAGFAAGVVSYGFADLPWTPVIASRFGLSTGDGDPDDATLTTFRAPFPPGRYFGESNPIGPGNVAGIGPYVTVYPIEGLSVTARYEAFWRLEDEDGLYSPPQVPLRMPGGDDHFVGQEFALVGRYSFNDYLSVTGTLAHFQTDAFLSDNLPNDEISFAQVKLIAQF